MGTGTVDVDKDGVVVSREGSDGINGKDIVGAERGGTVQVEKDVVRGVGIERPRVRYDVEVIAKLVVYSGIGWWAVEGIPIVFEYVGLGVGVR